VYHSTLGWRVIKKKKRRMARSADLDVRVGERVSEWERESGRESKRVRVRERESGRESKRVCVREWERE